MDLDYSKVDSEGQGHRLKVKVTRSKKDDFRSHLIVLQVMLEVKVTWVKFKGRVGQGQRSRGSRSA